MSAAGSIVIVTEPLPFGLVRRRVVACEPPILLGSARRGDPRRVLISACPTHVGTWRATVFEGNEPLRHINRPTAVEAAQWAVSDGFWRRVALFDDPKGRAKAPLAPPSPRGAPATRAP